jgi:hypothetical protein
MVFGFWLMVVGVFVKDFKKKISILIVPCGAGFYKLLGFITFNPLIF